MALIGSIIGDIIGSQYEFPYMRPDDLDWKNCELLTDNCMFTDDTVMSIATKVAIDMRGWDDIDFAGMYRKFGNDYLECGYGDMFENWITHQNAKPYQSYGNGSAMRVSYVADVNDTIYNAQQMAYESAICTHDSYGGIRGAVTTAVVSVMAKQGCTKPEIYNLVNNVYKGSIYDCSESLEELRKRYRWSEICDGTVPVAVRCFLESEDYESCIRNCLSLPCDMDTMCCIAGGIAESFYGTTGMDNERILKKYLDEYLYNCVEDMIQGGEYEFK